MSHNKIPCCPACGFRFEGIEFSYLGIEFQSASNASSVFYKNKHIELSPLEATTFVTLAMARGRVLSRQQIYDTIYPVDSTTLPKTIDIWVHRLRKRMVEEELPCKIVLAWGQGYRLVALGNTEVLDVTQFGKVLHKRPPIARRRALLIGGR